MVKQAQSSYIDGTEPAAAPTDEVATTIEPSLSMRARPLPRISIQAFCDSPDVAEAFQTVSSDRGLRRHTSPSTWAASQRRVAHYEESPTPNLIIVDSKLPGPQLLEQLDYLAQSCDAGTKVLVIGRANDVVLYRELLKRGVSEYMVAPIAPFELMEVALLTLQQPSTDPVGQVLAFVGAKGGVGSSTICHNVSWTISEVLQANVVITDLDLAFGTTGLDFNQDPVQGIADALQNPDRLDDVLLDRLLTTCSKHLSIFAAPASLDRDYDIAPEDCETVIDVVRQNVPYVALDLPHSWTPWKRRALLSADEIVITAAPDLANLRNAKALVDMLRPARKNDQPPHLILNMTNMPKRPEILTKEFRRRLGIKCLATIEFDCESFARRRTTARCWRNSTPRRRPSRRSRRPPWH